MTFDRRQIMKSLHLSATFLTGIFCLLSCFLTAQEKYFEAYPLYKVACELDTDCVTYSKAKVSVQLDSTFVKGKFDYSYEAHYDSIGNLTHSIMTFADKPGQKDLHSYGYDAHGMCIYSRYIITMNGDTTSVVTKRSLKQDTLKGEYEFLLTIDGATGTPDTVINELVLRYVDTKSKNRWSELHTNRYYFICKDYAKEQKAYSLVYGMHNSDTLYELRLMNAVNEYHTDTTTAYLRDGVVAYTIVKNGRITETKTWVDNRLAEHHVYEDSIVKYKVVQTRIYNELSPVRQQEILITYSDTLVVVNRGAEKVFTDFEPDTAWYLPPPPPMSPEPTMADFFPYRTATKMANGMTKLEYFNFRAGTTRPLLIIYRDDRGVVHLYEQKDWRLKREVW